MKSRLPSLPTLPEDGKLIGLLYTPENFFRPNFYCPITPPEKKTPETLISHLFFIFYFPAKRLKNFPNRMLYYVDIDGGCNESMRVLS